MNTYSIPLLLLALCVSPLQLNSMTQTPPLGVVQEALEPLIIKKNIMKGFGLARSRNVLNDRLFRLCESGSAEEIRTALAAGANPAAQADYIERHFDIIDLQSPENAGKRMGITPFQEAVRLGNEDAVKEFVHHGASLNDPLLLYWASQGLYVTIFQYLVEQGAPIDQLVSPRYDMNIAFPAEREPYTQQSLLVSLARGHDGLGGMFFEMHSRDIEVVKRLKDLATDELKECVAVLKHAGLDFNNKDAQQRTGLHIAALKRLPVATKVLIDAGAKVNEQDELGNTPLHYALANHPFSSRIVSSSLVDTLLRAGGSLMVRNAKGETPADLLLSTAAEGKLIYTDEFTSIQLLLNAGYIFNRLPKIGTWHYSFNGEKGGLDTLQYKRGLAQSLLNIAPFAYGIFVPDEDQLRAARSRTSALLVYFKKFHQDEITAPDSSLLCGYIRSKIMLADTDTKDGYSYEQDLFSLFLDHLRWGNPMLIDNFREAQPALIEIMVDHLMTLYTSCLAKYEDQAVTLADPETAHLKQLLHTAVQNGISARMKALAEFGQKTRSAGTTVQDLRTMLNTTFSHYTTPWKEHFLKTHGLLPVQSATNDDDN